MKKLYVSGNYIIYEDGAGSVLEYPKAFSVYTKSGDNLNYSIVEQSGIGIGKLLILVSDIPNIYNEAGDTAFDETTFVNFLRANTGFKSASGGSEAFVIQRGTTANRPLQNGEVKLYYDTDLGYLIISNGSNWENASGFNLEA